MSGGVVSIVQVRVAGVGSVFPELSVTRTANVRCPSESPVYCWGLEHGVHAPWSSWHSKVLGDSVAEKLNVAELELTSPLGPVLARTVSGGVLSAGLGDSSEGTGSGDGEGVSGDPAGRVGGFQAGWLTTFDLASGRLPLASTARVLAPALRRTQRALVREFPRFTLCEAIVRQLPPRRTWIRTRDPCGAPCTATMSLHFPCAPFAVIATAGPFFLASLQGAQRSARNIAPKHATRNAHAEALQMRLVRPLLTRRSG